MATEREDGPLIRAVERVASPAPFAALFLRTGAFPLSPEKRAMLSQLLLEWLDECAGAFHAEWTMGLQGQALHEKELVETLSSHAPAWMPDLGLGIRPCGDPPRLLTQADLDKVRWDQMPALKHETVFLLTSGGKQARSALLELGGRGVVVGCLITGPLDEYLKEQRALWLPLIQEPAFRAHPFYFPLLDLSCVENSRPSDLLTWLGRSVVYVRECAEAEGILVLSSRGEAMEWLERRAAAQDPIVV